MAGDEEARARASLAEMQGRISQGPEAALGLGETASPEEVRAAFLALTKQFHPARFGRMSSDLQRLSNEVFLGIKSAHDVLQRAVGGVVRGTRPNSASGAVPISPDATGRIPIPTRATSTMSAVRPSASQPPSNRPGVPETRRPSTPPMGVATRPATGTTPTTPVAGVPATRMVPRTATPPLGVAVTRAPTPVAPTAAARPGTPPPGARPGTPPPNQPRTVSRPTTPQADPSRVSPRPTTPPQTLRAATPPQTLRPGTPPATASKPGTSPPPQAGTPPRAAAVPDERVALREALSLLNDRDWTTARQALHNLAARVPQSKQYRALLCYARGREAQAAGKHDDAVMEVQRALQLDPELEQAKQALAELQRRR